ncbi:MAG: hypothetical protein SVK08_02325 [Halobacteriota archaeon]|nr:hypothetical protein [Halobacteriota archaeon]
MRGILKNIDIIRLMMLEEYRMQSAMIGKFQFLFFPVLISAFSLVISITSTSLLNAMPMERVYLLLHTIMIAYAMSVGAFALFGESIAERRFGQIDLMLSTPLTQPIDFKDVFLAFYIKDTIYYIAISIVPIITGILLSIPLTGFRLTSVIFLALTMTLSFLLGISFSFFLSSVYVRWRGIFAIIAGSILLLILGSYATGFFSIEDMIPTLSFQYTKDPLYLLMAILAILAFSFFALRFIKIEFGKRSQVFQPEIVTTEKRFGFMGGYSTFVAKEWLDMRRSRTLYPVMGSYVGTLVFLAVVLWFLRTVLTLSIQFGIVFYAAMIGFFGMTIYSWLNVIDSPDFYQLLPVTVPRLIKTKLLLFVILASLISSVFLVVLSIVNSEVHLIWLALLVGLTTTSYTVIVTAYLTGLRTNTYLFDPRILGIFAAMVVPPLVIIAIASFKLTEDLLKYGLFIAMVCALLLVFIALMYRGIERKWGSETFLF